MTGNTPVLRGKRSLMLLTDYSLRVTNYTILYATRYKKLNGRDFGQLADRQTCRLFQHLPIRLIAWHNLL